MSEQFKVKPMALLPYGVLDKLVQETYGMPMYEVIETEELVNRLALPVFDVQAAELDGNQQDRLLSWLSGETHDTPPVHILLQDMANHQVIAPGNYLITVSY